jgi:hypothetical protein
MAKVVSNTAGRVRVIFEGLVEDAEKFVRDNFPRHHVEPGSRDSDTVAPADVSVIDDDDNETSLHNGEFVPSEKGTPTKADSVSGDESGKHDAPNLDKKVGI